MLNAHCCSVPPPAPESLQILPLCTAANLERNDAVNIPDTGRQYNEAVEAFSGILGCSGCCDAGLNAPVWCLMTTAVLWSCVLVNTKYSCQVSVTWYQHIKQQVRTEPSWRLPNSVLAIGHASCHST